MNGRIFQLNCSQGGVPKLPLREALLTQTGLACDRQAHRKFHGGPQRALCLYSLERILELQMEGHPIYPGSAGENVTITGLRWETLGIGSRLALGDEVLIEVTSYTVPCQTIRESFAGGEFKRISQKLYPGWARLYARVLKAGRLAVSQPVRVLDAQSAASDHRGQTPALV